MSPVMIGLSLFATLTSTLSYLAYPGEMVKNGPMMFAQLTAFPVVLVVLGGLASNLLELCIKVVNLLTAPLFVLFFLALFVRRATPLGGAAAAVTGIAVASGIAFFKMFGLEFLWTAPCALVAGIVAGILVSLATSLRSCQQGPFGG